MADDIVQVERVVDRSRRRQATVADGHVAERLMGTKPVIIGKPTREDVSQMVLAENDEVVRNFVLGALNPGFGKRVRLRRRLHPIVLLACDLFG
jgi:hypothetical protein